MKKRREEIEVILTKNYVVWFLALLLSGYQFLAGGLVMMAIGFLAGSPAGIMWCMYWYFDCE